MEEQGGSDTLFASVNQQCFSLTTNQHQPPIINQPAVFFSHNKSAPATANRIERETLDGLVYT